MSKDQVQVCVTYVQVVEVEAETQECAEYMAFYAFDLDKAHRGESECWTVSSDELPEVGSWLDVPLAGFGKPTGETK